MAEEWRDVPGYVGSYQVSNLGRVRSLDRHVTQRNRWGGTQQKKVTGRDLKLRVEKDGYVTHSLLGKQLRPAFVHCLVARAFLASPDDPAKTQVNHRDGRRSHNVDSNLEWVTPRQNKLHSYHILGSPAPTPMKRAVLVGGVRYESLVAAAKAIGRRPTAIGMAIKHNRRCAGHSVEYAT